ncbi:Uma2 family endonuclease [Pimelobacter simplex]|uniref:Uma2 family endonuclease n=1 Tax=Nocardioides simplex TaxID=2045 RepID=UPI00381591A5
MSIGSESRMAVMSSEPRLERRAMSRAEFEALPREVRAEYVDGVALMSPPAPHAHQYAELRVARLIADALPQLRVGTEMGIDLGRSLRVADVAAYATTDDDGDGDGDEVWGRVPPVLVVEVLSRTTRSEDLIRKPREYLRGGIAHYWILDRTTPALTALTARDDEWEVVLELDAERPRGTVEVVGHGHVDVDLLALV